MSDYYEERLKQRVKQRVRPVQYLLLHIFLMVVTLIVMGASTDYGIVSEAAILVVSIAFVVSLIAHVFWRANQFIWQRVEQDEARKLMQAGKPKRELTMLNDDGELVDYDDYYDEYEARQASSSR